MKICAKHWVGISHTRFDLHMVFVLLYTKNESEDEGKMSEAL